MEAKKGENLFSPSPVGRPDTQAKYGQLIITDRVLCPCQGKARTFSLNST